MSKDRTIPDYNGISSVTVGYVFPNKEVLGKAIREGLHDREKLITNIPRDKDNIDLYMVIEAEIGKEIVWDELLESYVAVGIPSTSIRSVRENGLYERYKDKIPVGMHMCVFDLCILLYEPEEEDNHWDYIICFRDNKGLDANTFQGVKVCDDDVSVSVWSVPLSEFEKYMLGWGVDYVCIS